MRGDEFIFNALFFISIIYVIYLWFLDATKKKHLPGLKEKSVVQRIVPGPVLEGLVEPTLKEKNDIMALINRNMSYVNIKAIKKVKNSFLESMYLLKKEEYKYRNLRVKEKKLIHVTGKSKVTSIISDNFDWRRVTRGLFGLGTSFSDDAKYANKQANNRIGCERAFIITKVLVSESTYGSEELKVPPLNYDTTTGNGSKVYVKFCDHEILPLFVVYYNTSTDLPHHVHANHNYMNPYHRRASNRGYY